MIASLRKIVTDLEKIDMGNLSSIISELRSIIGDTFNDDVFDFLKKNRNLFSEEPSSTPVSSVAYNLSASSAASSAAPSASSAAPLPPPVFVSPAAPSASSSAAPSASSSAVVVKSEPPPYKELDEKSFLLQRMETLKMQEKEEKQRQKSESNRREAKEARDSIRLFKPDNAEVEQYYKNFIEYSKSRISRQRFNDIVKSEGYKMKSICKVKYWSGNSEKIMLEPGIFSIMQKF